MTRIFAASITAICAIAGACASDVNPIPMTNNRASLAFRVDGVRYEGFGVVQRRPSGYRIEFENPPKTIAAFLNTCGREVDWRNPGDVTVFDFVPMLYIENEDACIITYLAITERGERFKAMIDQTDRRRLPARQKCNGRLDRFTGVGLCQARKGKYAHIIFDRPTVWGGVDKCPEPKELSGFAYEIRLGEGFCPYEFIDQQGQSFRWTTYGYTTIEEYQLPK